MARSELLTLDGLQAQFPGWKIREAYIAGNSGPGQQRYSASRSGVLVSSLSLDDLTVKIQREEQQRGW
jgi:hypothetical protein